MRIRFFVIGFSAVLLGGGFAVQACGGTQSDSTPATDAGQDVVDATVKDTFVPDVVDAAPACDKNADFLKDVPDAAIADGGSSVGICLGCAKVKCANEINACKADCPCQGVAAKGLECIAKAQTQAQQLACASSFTGVPSSTQKLGLALAGCLSNNCDNECQASNLLDGGPDADAN
jgi:hypothetical protein